jgi:fibronectin type 3 domain-containing protein
MPHDYNGYVTWGPRDELWVYASRAVGRPYLSEIQSFHAEPVPGDVVNRFRICHTGLWPSWCLDSPQASPDGTKVLFNSNMLGSVDVYYVVARLPEPPRDVTAERNGNSINLRWAPPAHHAEIMGYHVYRSSQSGAGFVPVTAEPVRGLQFTDREALPDGPAYYAVTAVEHSGLESTLSDEAGVGDEGADHTIFLEAERGQRDHSMWVAYEGDDSNLYHVWLRKDDRTGQVEFRPDHPGGDKPWFVWARVKGDNGVNFTVSADNSVQLSAPPSSEWTWVRSDTPLNWASADTRSRQPDRGRSEEEKQARRPVRVTGELYGSSVDCLLLTTNAGFSPASSPRIAWPGGSSPGGVSARAISPYSVKVSWSCDVPGTFHHFNLYRGQASDFEIGQAALVASPDTTGHVDWGLQPGQTYYYRITWVDRAGNESPPSPPARVSTPGVERVMIEPPAGERITFQVPRKGEYVLWLELKLGKGGGQYIDVQVDKQRQHMWCIVPDRNHEVSWHTYGEWGRFQLEAGAHTLTLTNKTGHRVQRVLITSDHSFKPPGHVNILRGW